MTSTKIVADGLVFPESPRWYDGKLWITDMFANRLVTINLDGTSTLVAKFDDRVTGLGFLPDGIPLVALTATRQVVAVVSGRTVAYADLTALPIHRTGDMIVDGLGRAYVDGIARLSSQDNRVELEDMIVLIEPDRSFHAAVRGSLLGPNGLAISPSGEQLVVAETAGRRISTFAIGPGGSLTDRRLLVENIHPDGLCLDAEGAVWVGSPSLQAFYRILATGTIDRTIPVTGKWAIACVLGGPDRKTLFMTTAKVPDNLVRGLAGNLDQSHGFIEVATVEVPGAGIP